MKLIFLFLLFFSFSNSSYLLTLESNNSGSEIYCIENYFYITQKDSGNALIYITMKDGNTIPLYTSNYKNHTIKQGYQNINNICYFDSSDYLGLDYEQFNYLMAFYGILLSSVVSFGLIKGF